jgi:hypothetical protein
VKIERDEAANCGAEKWQKNWITRGIAYSSAQLEKAGEQ